MQTPAACQLDRNDGDWWYGHPTHGYCDTCPCSSKHTAAARERAGEFPNQPYWGTARSRTADRAYQGRCRAISVPLENFPYQWVIYRNTGEPNWLIGLAVFFFCRLAYSSFDQSGRWCRQWRRRRRGRHSGQDRRCQQQQYHQHQSEVTPDQSAWSFHCAAVRRTGCSCSRWHGWTAATEQHSTALVAWERVSFITGHDAFHSKSLSFVNCLIR